jgi:hypothetical protein
VGDLRPGWRDEVVEDPGGDILRSGVRSAIAPSRCSSTMCCAPPSRSIVSTRSSVEPDARSSSQRRCMTSWRRRLDPPTDVAASTPRGRRVPARSDSDLVEHARRGRSRRTPPRPWLHGALDRSQHRCSRRQRRVESRRRVARRLGILPVKRSSLASESSRGDENVDARWGGKHAAGSASANDLALRRPRGRGSTPRRGRGRYVTRRLRPLERRHHRPFVSPEASTASERATCRIVAPTREDHHQRLFRQRPERARDRGAATTTFDAARPVEDGEPRGDEVGHDDLGLPLASEEQERIELGVLEGVQPLYGDVGAMLSCSSRLSAARRSSPGRRRLRSRPPPPERLRECARRVLDGQSDGDRAVSRCG